MPGSEIVSYMYNSNTPGTKTVVPRVCNVPHGVETVSYTHLTLPTNREV